HFGAWAYFGSSSARASGHGSGAGWGATGAAALRPQRWMSIRRPIMKIGVVFPQTEFGNDPAAIKDYAQAVEQMGYSHIIAYDHVLGANPERPGGWTGPYTYETPFHEPFVLFGFMAAVTERVEFCPGVLILPQRQTALVAKQAATLDVLCGGRFRLGVGLG